MWMKKSDFKWTESSRRFVEEIKKKVMESPMLPLSYFEKVFQFEYDEIGLAIVYLLIEEGRPIPFFNEKMDKSKQKCFVYDQ